MTVRLSTGMRAAMLNGGANGGMKGALSGGTIRIYSGPQPISADAPATGTLLGIVTVDGAGGGLHFDTSTDGTLSKAAAENWKFNGIAAGTAGWFRFIADGGDPDINSSVEARIDGSIATSGGDVSITNVAITVGSPNTVDVFSFTLPPQ